MTRVIILLLGLLILLLPHAVHAAETSEYDLVRVDLRQQSLRLFWKTSDGTRVGSIARLQQAVGFQGKTVLFATNAGIYTTDYAPEGLHIENGQELRPLNLGDGKGNFYWKPNGVFYIDGEGAHIVESSTFKKPESIRLATQSGPLLLKDGKKHPGFSPKSKSTFIRSAVCVISPKDVVFVISKQPVTFHNVAEFLTTQLQCPDALYLDGAISQLYAPFIGREETGGDFAGILAVVDESTPRR